MAIYPWFLGYHNRSQLIKNWTPVIVALPTFNMRDVDGFSGQPHLSPRWKPGLSNLDRGFLADSQMVVSWFVRLMLVETSWLRIPLTAPQTLSMESSWVVLLVSNDGYDSAEVEGQGKWERQRDPKCLPTWCFAVYIFVTVLDFCLERLRT